MADNIAWLLGGALGFFIIGPHVSDFLESILSSVLPQDSNSDYSSQYGHGYGYSSDPAGDHY